MRQLDSGAINLAPNMHSGCVKGIRDAVTPSSQIRCASRFDDKQCDLWRAVDSDSKVVEVLLRD